MFKNVDLSYIAIEVALNVWKFVNIQKIFFYNLEPL